MQPRIDYLANNWQALQQQAEHLRRQSLLQHLKQLLGLSTHRNSIAEVFNSSFNITLSKQFFTQLDLEIIAC